MIKYRINLAFLYFLSLTLILWMIYSINEIQRDVTVSSKLIDILDFEGFNNETGHTDYIVPNIVHLLYFGITELKFYQLINIYSIYINHKPDWIYIHCDNECSFRGTYWQEIQAIDDLRSRIRLNKIPYRSTIFGVKYGWINHHRSDVWRLLVLMNYGGIFLDNDMFVINSLNKYRRYEMTVSWDGPEYGVGVQVLIAHRNARLLRAHFDAYRTNYTPKSWYHNAGHVPASILIRNPELAHSVKTQLGTQNLFDKLYWEYWPDWTTLDSIHLLINHRKYLDKNSSINEFNHENIQTYDMTFGHMCRHLLGKIRSF